MSEIISKFNLHALRAIRDAKLNEVDLIYCNAERWASMHEETRVAWSNYKQELRNLPNTCDPNNPVWPTPPG